MRLIRVLGRGGLLFADDADHLGEAGAAQPLMVEGWLPGQELVEQNAETVDVGPGVHVQTSGFRLLRCHVGRRADELAVLGEERLLGQFSAGRLGDSEVDHLGQWHIVVHCDEHVGRFDVAVDDALLVRVLDGVAHLPKEVQALSSAELFVVAELRYGRALDQFHHEVGSAGVGSAGVVYLGDPRVVHQGQGLSLGFKAGDDLPRVHAELDDLERHPALDRLALLGQPDDTEAALADLLEQPVPADRVALRLCHGARGIRRVGVRGAVRGACFVLGGAIGQEAAGLGVGLQQLLDLLSQVVVVAADFAQEGLLPCPHQLAGFNEDAADGALHWSASDIRDDRGPHSSVRKR